MIPHIVVAVFLVAAEGLEQRRLVYPRVLEERSPDGRMVMHLHDGLTLNLRKASVAAREFRVLEHEDGRQVTHFFNGEDFERHLHEDENQLASVHVVQKEGGVEVEGVVGPHQRIQPMTEMERSDEGLIPHMIYEIEKKELFDIEVKPTLADAQWVNERSYDTRNVPDVVQIELFIVTDRLHFKLFRLIAHLIKYLCVHVNSVNLRYADARNPKVKFMLVGVERDEFSTYKVGDGVYLEASPTLENFKDYANKKRSEFGHPDMVYLMTGYTAYSPGPNKTKDTNTLGIGYVGGICSISFVALGEDVAGTYSGTHTLTHESGHVLGASHDESDPKPWIPGDPGSRACPWKTGHLMSYVDGGPLHHRFSKCSLRQIQNVLIMVGVRCWAVTNQGRSHSGRYAGMEVKANEYCQKAVFPKRQNVTADLMSPSVKQCKLKCQYRVPRLQCFNNGYCQQYFSIYYVLAPALDYMPCGFNEICIRGVCTRKQDVATEAPEPQTQQAESTQSEPTTPSAASTDECRCDCSSTTTTGATSTLYGPRPPRRNYNRKHVK